MGPGRDGDTLSFEVGHQRGKTFFKRATLAGRIPDKMANPERGKVLSRIPTCQSRHSARAFVLPDALTHPLELVGR